MVWPLFTVAGVVLLRVIVVMGLPLTRKRSRWVIVLWAFMIEHQFGVKAGFVTLKMILGNQRGCFTGSNHMAVPRLSFKRSIIFID